MKTFGTGLVAGISARAVMLLVVDSTATLLIGLGLMLILGVLLMFPERTWLSGVGFLIGAAISVAAAFALAAIWVARHTV
jgi:hypothetical protein